MPIITELIKSFAHTVKYFAAIQKNAVEVNALIQGDSQDYCYMEKATCRAMYAA